MGGEERRGVEKGDLVFSSLPFVHVLANEARGSLCDQCLLPLPSCPLSCPSCSCLLYCSPSCLASDSLHPLECAYPGLQELGDQARVLARLLLRVATDGGMKQSEELPYGLGPRRLADLMTHSEQYLGEEARRKPSLLYHQLQEVLPQEVVGDWQHFIGLYGRFMVNSFSITSFEVGSCGAEKEVVGYSLYLAPCILDHSCAPNAKVSFKGSRLEIRSTSSCPDLGKVRISYLDTGLPRTTRRALLKERYFFACLCPPCLGEQVPGNTTPPLAFLAIQEHCAAEALEGRAKGEDRLLLGAMLCQGCAGGVWPQGGSKCQHCGEEVQQEQVREYRTSEECVSALLASKSMPQGSPAQYIELLTELFHPYNLTVVRCTQAAMCSAVLRGEVKEALEWGEQVLAALKRLGEGSEAEKELEGRMGRLREEMDRLS